MARPRVEVVHVGSACRDVVPEDPRGWRLGGGVTYASLTTARLGLRTAAMIGVDAEAARASELDLLRDASVQIQLVELAAGPIFENLETPAGRVQTALAVGEPVPMPDHLPSAWRDAAAWSLVPVADEVPGAWAGVPAPGALLSVGWQGLLRRLVAGDRVRRRPPGPSPLLARADIVGVSRLDVDPATSFRDLARWLRPAARLCVTDGPAGGVLVTIGADGAAAVRYAPAPIDRDLDPTGAGDVFLAAVLAAAVRPAILGGMRDHIGSDLRLAAVAGSLTVERVGVDAVPWLTAIRARASRDPDHGRRVVYVPMDSKVGSAG